MARSSSHLGEAIAPEAAIGDPGGGRHACTPSLLEPRLISSLWQGYRPARKFSWLLSSILATSALTPILSPRQALAESCSGAVLSGEAAPPAKLYDHLRGSTDADLLAIEFNQRVVAKTCAWVYAVKVLTAAGAVVELDFAAESLDLVGARGPLHDRDAADLLKQLGADAALLNADAPGGESGRPSATTSQNQDGDSSGANGGSDGSSGSGSGGSGSGGNSGSGGSSGSDSGSGDSGGDDSGGGEGGEGGGSDD